MGNTKYRMELRTNKRGEWSSDGRFGLSIDEARKEMARLAEEYWLRQTDRDEDEAEWLPRFKAWCTEALPGEESSTDLCDGWEMRIVVDD